MRRLLLLLALLSLPLAGAELALAQTAPAGPEGRLSASRPDAGALGLRGAEAFAPPTPGQAEAKAEAEPAADLGLRPLGAAAAPPLASLPPAPDARQCRLACAQDYYFCLAGDASDECPQAWGQCRLGCDPRPGLGG